MANPSNFTAHDFAFFILCICVNFVSVWMSYVCITTNHFIAHSRRRLMTPICYRFSSRNGIPHHIHAPRAWLELPDGGYSPINQRYQPLLAWNNSFRKIRLTPVLNFFRKTSNIFAFYIISQTRDRAGSWNYTLQKTVFRFSVDSRYVHSQWETLLQSSTVSHWLGANLKSALYGLRGCCNLSNEDISSHGVDLVLENSAFNIRRSMSCWKYSNIALRPRQNGRHFADDIFKCIFLNEYVWFPIKILLKFVPKRLISNIPALFQKIMAWRRPGYKPLSKAMWLVYRRIYASLGLNEIY